MYNSPQILWKSKCLYLCKILSQDCKINVKPWDFESKCIFWNLLETKQNCTWLMLEYYTCWAYYDTEQKGRRLVLQGNKLYENNKKQNKFKIRFEKVNYTKSNVSPLKKTVKPSSCSLWTTRFYNNWFI